MYRSPMDDKLEAWNALYELDALRHRYFLVRHGESKPNVLGKIVSNPIEGIKDENGLTARGIEQARDAGKQMLKIIHRVSDDGEAEKGEKFFPTIDSAPTSKVVIVTSDFSRARQTAQEIGNVLNGAVTDFRTDTALRERDFGSWDGKSHEHYKDVWKDDEKNPFHEENGVESCASVLKRTTSVIARLEEEFKNSDELFVIVSHGDALQILQTGFLKLNPSQHRSLPHLGNCEVRCPTLAGR